MSKQSALTDHKALTLHRRRVKADAMFLHHAAADEVHDRMGMVNKSFNSVAVVTGFPDLWSSVLPLAQVLADTETLDLTAGQHDLVIHAMALHWANDPVGQLIQCRRAMAPDGLFLSVAFGGQTLHELRACLGQAEAEVTGGMSPRVAPMAELRDMGGLLQRAGFALPVADTQTLTVEYTDMRHLMRDLRAMGETNALAARLRRPTAGRVMHRAAELYAQHFATDTQRVTATFELVYLTGWAPADSQPKPLRPGSAQQRLADALRTEETKLPD
ncbi:SAM-dependent methyltransferase [Sulfitobacter noctilucae]|uniref:methyltransferase domain-containing protein n=1 Tax=Sulfitobacter noctilucae TaxID=1342302 RepID=UPI00046A2A25|nr:methyltransferase domain-containing protein [Sulfitobacter noctilucae]KIN65710.1 SAM-dependent methyltransferase [Sulfitobacter noctilucae]